MREPVWSWKGQLYTVEITPHESCVPDEPVSYWVRSRKDGESDSQNLVSWGETVATFQIAIDVAGKFIQKIGGEIP